MAKKQSSSGNIGVIVLFIVLFIAVFGSVLLYRTASTGRFVDATVAKQYVFNEPKIRDTRLLYCPDGLAPFMKNANLEAHINAGRYCIPSPYANTYPYLKEYYCCAPVFKERYIDELPRDPSAHS
ncbi:hypothetical protein KY314_01975 [Candidatus Woesearchaeota archaeon]|nr:hypothetical protein [Candidatus Woesearchaeota archaeon]